ncbi:hypothetical protein [Actinomadura madurae]|uniref:hypothetical protein n=1 Tax=Actinomadura madurae TaxID=1993 RepID=UPI002026E3BC|nr:hypothetical protein [Actinomadura madurae]MCP9949507.1 hypothetical protein [Actinomadura madurae]MCQ0009727.1 hypothetical protein [Actinomadura madurae]URN01905.1 hypothetical protein LUW76_12350 [Actinomadura madurae]URN05770.1 hypothetical protein LUW74_22275 [Actinomadura madurae]
MNSSTVPEHQDGPLPGRQNLHRRHHREPYVTPHVRIDPRVGKGLEPWNVEHRRERSPGIDAGRAQPGRQRPP